MKKLLSIVLSVLMFVTVISSMPLAFALYPNSAPEMVWQTEPYADFAADAPITTVRIDNEKINRENAAISYRDTSKRFDINQEGYVYAENCRVTQGGYVGLGGFTLTFADAAVFPDGSRQPLEVVFGEVHTIGRTDVEPYADDFFFARITDNPDQPIDFAPLSLKEKKQIGVRSRVYFRVPTAGAEDTFLFAANGINTVRTAGGFDRIVDAGGHYNYSESMEPMSGIAEGTDFYYPPDTKLIVTQGTTAGSLGVRFVGSGGPAGEPTAYQTGFAAAGKAKEGFSSRVWSSCGTNTVPLPINLLTSGLGYDLTTAAGENGSISLWTDGIANSENAAQLSGGTTQTPLTYLVPKGKAVTLVITPDIGYELDTLTVDGTAVQPTRSSGICGPYEYDIPADTAARLGGDNCAVNATFKQFEKRTMEMRLITCSWTYGEDSSMCLRVSPASIPAYATVTKLYKERGADDSTYTTEKPTQAGDYTVKFIRSETYMYKEDVQIVDFTIYQADPTCTAPTGLAATYGDTLSRVELPEGWQWDDAAQLVGNVGDNSFSATFTPADARNYKSVSETLSVSVAKKTVTITADNKETNHGSDLTALTYIIQSQDQYYDDEGELGISLSTDADKNKAGAYEIVVTYQENPNYLVTVQNGTYTVGNSPHTWGDVTYTWTGIASVKAERKCVYCDETETETQATTSQQTKAPACTDMGETTYTATFSNPAFETQTKTVADIDATGHAYGKNEYTWETDKSACTAVCRCTNTGCTQAITETAQSTCATTVKPTCEGKGEYTYTAAFNNKRFTAQTATEEIAALGHVYDSVVTEPTCTAGGFTTHICSRCSDTYTDSETAALGHTAGDAVQEKEVPATCEKDGSYAEAIYCAVCGEELSRKTVTVPAAGHEDADNDGKCDRCSKQMQGGDHCKLCGQIHDKHTFCGVVTGWFHTLAYYAKTYVDPVLGILWASFLTMLFP